MNKTKIDWCDYSWNPVVGCKNHVNCRYCYGVNIANRFYNPDFNGFHRLANGSLKILDKPLYDSKGNYIAFPWCYEPTFHCYRLDQPQKLKKPANIFVCSMADLFGDWVPDEWIEQVFEACRKAPQHNYLFLTKNPDKMGESVIKFGKSKNWWFGQTIDKMCNFTTALDFAENVFTSYEPLLSEMPYDYHYGFEHQNWLIFGALTKKGKPVEKPYWDWIKDLVMEATDRQIPIFMKQSLKGFVPEDYFVQQYPEGLKK